jgi:hypothetical protein
MMAMFARQFDGGSNAPSSHNMIILDQYTIAEIMAMILPTSNAYRVLFEDTPSWCRFPGIHDRSPIGFDSIHITPSQRGYSTQSLQEIESDAFPCQQ